MTTEIGIGDRLIGEGHPLFIMAETGVTCNYDLQLTKQLVDVVREAGGDAIKLIFWFPGEIMSDRSVIYTYETESGPRSENMYEMLDKLRFSFEQWVELKKYADKRGVILFATVNSPSGIDYSQRLGLTAYKLSSWDYNYLSLWEQIARLGKPMVLDTGPVTAAEVANTLQLIRNVGNDQIVLLHCFHTDDYAQMNLRSIPYMRIAFNTLVGYSSQGRSSETDVMAVALGAVMLEKRLTMSRKLPGHHHILSMEPEEFTDYVKLMRSVQAALGEHNLKPSAGDRVERPKWFRHLVANRPLTRGIRLTADMLEGKRPENGVSPEHLRWFIGRELRRDLAFNEALDWNDV